MNKFVHTLTAVVIALGLLFGASTFAPSQQAEAREDIAAIVLSASMSGVGEWYNAGFSGGFPLVECILGSICPCIALSSIIDAAAGKTDDAVRFDFWASPN